MRTLDQGGWSRDEALLPPPAHLAALVEFMWVDEWSRGYPTGGYRIVPDDAPHLILNVSGRRHRSMALNVVGSRRIHTDIDVSARVLTVGIRFKPGAVPALFGCSASQFTDQIVPFKSLLPQLLARDVRRLRVRSPHDVLGRITTALADLAGDGCSLDWRAKLLTESPAPTSIANAADKFGVTTRALHAWSKRTFGMSLQQFFKIRRLHSALGLHIVQGEQHWSRVATEAGYSDHSHLIRDSHALLGESPGAFLRRADLFKRRTRALR